MSETRPPLEGESKQFLFSFSYEGKQFSVFLENVQEYTHGQRADFLVYDENGQAHGKIHGNLAKDGNTFISFNANNIMRRLDPDRAVSGLMKETIAQILGHDVVHTWKSSIHLGGGGEKLYQRLSTDARLSSTEEAEEGGKRIVLRKRDRE